MWFLPSVTQTCDACGGTGYRREVADLVERGRTLADIEALTIAELVDEWGDIDAVRRVGDAALALGLGYLIVRQPGWSLSGGEAQRLKLAKELARPRQGRRPLRARRAHRRSAGHRRRRARPRPRRVVDAGNTVLVVEHDPVLLATCDWLIELGPGAGPDGGEIIFEGTPEAARRRPTRRPRRTSLEALA